MTTDEIFDIERIVFSQFVKDGSGWIEILANSSLFRTFPSLEVRVPRILKGFFFASMRFFRKKSDLSHSCLRIFVKHLEYWDPQDSVYLYIFWYVGKRFHMSFWWQCSRQNRRWCNCYLQCWRSMPIDLHVPRGVDRAFTSRHRGLRAIMSEASCHLDPQCRVLSYLYSNPFRQSHAALVALSTLCGNWRWR